MSSASVLVWKSLMLTHFVNSAPCSMSAILMAVAPKTTALRSNAEREDISMHRERVKADSAGVLADPWEMLGHLSQNGYQCGRGKAYMCIGHCSSVTGLASFDRTPSLFE